MDNWSRDADDMETHYKEQQRQSAAPTQARVLELRNPNIVKIAFKFENGPCAANGKWYGIQAYTDDTIEDVKNTSSTQTVISINSN